MTRAVAVLLLLAGCAGPETPCERAADNDPAVRELLMIGAGSPVFLANHQEELALARRRATMACQRGRSLGPVGGVEPRQAR